MIKLSKEFITFFNKKRDWIRTSSLFGWHI